MDIYFFGTHNFAATILQGLLTDSVLNIKKVITQPDKPAGREQKLLACPVKILAQKYNLKLEQPVNLKNFDSKIKDHDLNIVVDYGHIIPLNIIKRPGYGSLNIHPSLLPKYRGPSPIQSALLNGDCQTGVTIMLMDEKMDHGPILAQKSLLIEPDDNYLSLSHKLATQAKELLLQAILEYVNGKIKPQPQNHSLASFCQMLDRADGLVNINKNAVEIYNQYRALASWPGIWTKVKNKRLKLLKVALADKQFVKGRFTMDGDRLYLGCGSGAIEILELQWEGKNPINAKTFINGYKNLNGYALT